MGNYCITKYHSDEKLLKWSFHKGYWLESEVCQFIHRKGLVNLHRLDCNQYSLYYEYILQHDIHNYTETRVVITECTATKYPLHAHYGIPKKRINDIL